jgi:rRNA pseudouridine-1189 N-methylase Emg1 (Nep1/Mra1 family)
MNNGKTIAEIILEMELETQKEELEKNKRSIEIHTENKIGNEECIVTIEKALDLLRKNK